MKHRKSSTKPQILNPMTLTRCTKCGKIVKWRVLSVYKCADAKHVIRYLKCPTNGCEGRARQIADVAP
ncbi:MAG: hypothetical protein IKQ17_05910 [Kiritimatiellae bacterium]|nr:hypothetical protein [Kiritimatiellia bacterium]